jgi:hypothetical protein
MPRAGLTAGQYRKHIIKVVHRVGLSKALAHTLFGVVFSGPSVDTIAVIGFCSPSNNPRSEEMADRLHATRINDTWIFKFLDGRDLAGYFRRVYAPLIKKPVKLEQALEACYVTVWGGLSTLFAGLPFREVATAVCGAGRDRVFLRYELPSLVQNPHIEVCNEIPMEAVRRMYNEVGKDEAFNLVCLSELRMTFRYASKGATSPTHAWQDFVDRTHFYQGERTATSPTRKPLTADQERRKQQIIADFGLGALYATAPSAWGGALMPAYAAPKHCGPVLVAA